MIWTERQQLHGAKVQRAIGEGEKPFGFFAVALVAFLRQGMATAGHVGVIAEAIFLENVAVFSEQRLVAAFNDGANHAADMEVIKVPPIPNIGVVLIEDGITVDPTK